MRRVLRWAWNGAAALSLLLCVGACALWVRSISHVGEESGTARKAGRRGKRDGC